MKLPFCNPTARRTAEFSLRCPENLLLVQRTESALLIYATANNLTLEQRAAFIRYLRAEGFVGGDFTQWSHSDKPIMTPGVQPVRWVIDPCWPEVDPAYALHIQRLCWYTA